MSGRDLFGRPLPTSTSASSSGAGSRPYDPHEALKRDAFRKLKPTCVSLMGLAGSQPTNASPHASVIDSLRSIVETLPDQAFSPALINYLIFPVTTILRQADPTALPDRFLEAAFRLLATVVGHWKKIPGGMEVASWEQLWRFVVGVTVRPESRDKDTGKGTGSGTGSGKGKGNEKEVLVGRQGEEVRLEATRFLLALLEPSSSPAAVHPSPAMRKAVNGPTAPLIPTLFQSISFAVDCATPLLPHPTLQRAALALLPVLLGYIGGQPSLLASVLPGVVSAMAKSVTREGKNLKGDIAAGMGGVVRDVVVETLADDSLRRLGVLRPEFDNLEDLANDWARSGGQDVEDIGEHDIAVEDITDIADAAAQPGQGKRPDPFPPLTEKYLSFTAQQLQVTVPRVLSTLTAHTSHLARIAAADLAAALMTHCRDALPRLSPAALSTLLLLSTDEFEPVSLDATRRLKTLLAAPDTPALDTTLVDLLSGAVNALPRLIRSAQDARIDETARLVTAIAKITDTGSSERPNAIAAFLGPAGLVERWGWALLDCLEFGRPRGWSANSNAAARTAELGWNRGLVTSSLPLLIGSSNTDEQGERGASASTSKPGASSTTAAFPHLSLRYVESEKTSRALADMLRALGAAGGETALYSVDYFIRFAKAHRRRDVSKAVSAVWVTELLLGGVASTSVGTKQPKAVRKMAKEVARVLVAMDDEEDEDVEWDGPQEQPDPDAGDAVVRTKGLDQLTTLLDRTPRHSAAAHETRALHARAQRVLLSAVSLSALSSCAGVLGTSFRPLLLHALYLVLAHLSSPHELVRQFAEAALVRIAFDTGYASAYNLVLDNVDYVVNVVSQRLTYHRLSPHAPLVLIAMIRLVGAPIVPLVHDVVDEIFDALDDFHGYAALASALLAVLTTLIDAMASDPEAEPVPDAERAAAKEDAARFLAPPNPKSDFARFAKWYSERGAAAQREIDEILQRAPRQPWGKDSDGDEAMDQDNGDNAKDNGDKETPPTRTQQVAVQILDKATFYLSHGSPFLRARVLGLTSRAIPVLARAGREGDLLPVVDRAWSSILARLDDPFPYVATEAAEVIASLAENVGEYVSRRVADDAWPKLLRLLNAQAEADKRSALARRGAVGTVSEHSVSHRLYAALLGTATFIAAQVPVKDGLLWDMMLAFRPLLDRRAHTDLQARARSLYAALDRRDGDALWVAMRATLGEERGVWAYLADPALDIGANVARVLGGAGKGGDGDDEAEVEAEEPEVEEPEVEELKVDEAEVEPEPEVHRSELEDLEIDLD